MRVYPEISEDKTRLLIEMNDVGDTVQFTRGADGSLNIEIDEPWAGCTESGFGATTRITLTPSVLTHLKRWIE